MRTKRSSIQNDLYQLMLDFSTQVAAAAQQPEPAAEAPALAVVEAQRQVEAEVSPEPTGSPEPAPPLQLTPIATTTPAVETFEELIADGLTRASLSERAEGGTLLHYLVATDRLQEVSATWLTADVLSSPDQAGNTPCHLAAAKGILHQLPQDELTPTLVETENDAGQNLLQVAVAAETLAQVPVDLLTAEGLAQPDKAGHSALAYAQASGQEACLPKALLPGNEDAEAFEASAEKEVEAFMTSTVVQEANQCFEEVAREVLDQEPDDELEEEVADEELEESEVEAEIEAAEVDPMEALYQQYGQQEVAAHKPVEELTAEDLLVADEKMDNETPLHIILLDGDVNQLPPGIVTEAACLMQDAAGNTPVHLVGRYLAEVPAAIYAVLTEEVLLTPDNNGTAAVHEFAKEGKINLLPKELLTYRVQMTPDAEGYTAADYADAAGVPCEVEADGFGSVPVVSPVRAQGPTAAQAAAAPEHSYSVNL